MKKNMLKLPFPPTGGGIGEIIRKIINVTKGLIGLFKKPSKEAGETDSLNDNSSLENVDHIIQIFSDFKEQVYTKAVEVESAVAEEVNYYVEELQDILINNADKVDKYGIHTKRIERQIDKISTRIKGTINNELSKKVSLDDSECKKILKMIPGVKKEAAMDRFLNTAVNGALTVCCAELHACLDEIYEDVESEIIETVESIQKQNEQLKVSLSRIDRDNYEMTAKQQMINAYYLIDACDTVLEIL